MFDDAFRHQASHIDAQLREERDRLVVLLRQLADKIEAAPLARVSEGLTWVATAAEGLVRSVERVLGGRASS
jgi:hypothetical protein